MKRILILAALFMLVSGSAFAATVTPASGTAGYVLNATTPAATLISKMSKSVVFGAQYNALGYAIMTYHISGTKAYGTAYDATAIYVDDVGAGWTGYVVPSSSVAEDAFDGWNTL